MDSLSQIRRWMAAGKIGVALPEPSMPSMTIKIPFRFLVGGILIKVYTIEIIPNELKMTR